MLKEIFSYSQLNDLLKMYSNVYLMLYKPGLDNSECALENIAGIHETNDDKTILAMSDVSKVRDIHEKYNIESVPTLLIFRNGKLGNVVKGCMTKEYYESLIKELYPVANLEKSRQKRVLVYSTNSCPWCTTLKDHLRKNSIVFTEVDVSNDHNRAEEMRRKSGKMGVPQTEIDGQMIIGFDKSKINALLGIN
ncbi:MAG: glutaredoxin domain-containing protein [Deltaproteobacteria bacterium]